MGPQICWVVSVLLSRLHSISMFQLRSPDRCMRFHGGREPRILHSRASPDLQGPDQSPPQHCSCLAWGLQGCHWCGAAGRLAHVYLPCQADVHGMMAGDHPAKGSLSNTQYVPTLLCLFRSLPSPCLRTRPTAQPKHTPGLPATLSARTACLKRRSHMVVLLGLCSILIVGAQADQQQPIEEALDDQP